MRIRANSPAIPILLVLLAAANGCADTSERRTRAPFTPAPEILYVHPDGRMTFNGRPIASPDVVIYPDGKGGERAAVRLRIPRHPDVYRDTITVEREERDVAVQRIGG